MTKPPIQWFGGKSEFLDRILPLFPKHHTFVDGCGGSAAVILGKEPSAVDVYNDVDHRLVNFFWIIRNRPEELALKMLFTPYARAEYKNCKEEDDRDAMEDARRFATVAKQSMGGAWGRAWSSVVTHSRRGMASSNSRWLNLPVDILAAAERLSTIQIENLDLFDLIRRYDRPETLFYLDPPYHPETRTPKVYRFETTAEWHTKLLDCLRSVRESVVLSGYSHPEYESRLADWERHEFQVSCRSNVHSNGSISGAPKRTEVVWIKGARA